MYCFLIQKICVLQRLAVTDEIWPGIFWQQLHLVLSLWRHKDRDQWRVNLLLRRGNLCLQTSACTGTTINEIIFFCRFAVLPMRTSLCWNLLVWWLLKTYFFNTDFLCRVWETEQNTLFKTELQKIMCSCVMKLSAIECLTTATVNLVSPIRAGHFVWLTWK